MDWKKLLRSITTSVDEELRLRNEYLMTENRMLRQQRTGRVQLTDSDRQALAEIGIQLGKKALEEIATVAKPATILAWHRKFTSPLGNISQLPKSVGRPRIDQEIEDVVVRMARENRSWGYDRIVGAIANLGSTISDQTVGNILKRHGIPPAPQRQQTVTWREFIRIHLEGLGATDFFSRALWAWFAFIISWVLSFLLPDRCRKHVASMKSYLLQWWTLVVPLWSLHMCTPRGSWRSVVNEGTRAWRELCSKYVHRQPSSESASYNPQGVLHQGIGRVVFLPVVHPHAIRDGPMPHRQWPGESLPYANGEAA